MKGSLHSEPKKKEKEKKDAKEETQKKDSSWERLFLGKLGEN